MKLRMAQNSIFAILLRSRWWISVLVGAGAAALAFAIAPRQYAPYAAFGAAPFFVIAVIAASRQWRAPSPARVARAREAAQAMSWPQWSEAVQSAYEREGWRVARLAGAGADFELSRGARRTVVSCRRWKVARIGVEPLRELHDAAQARDADEGLYLSLGEPTEQAARFAQQRRLRLVGAEELARLLAPSASAGRTAGEAAQPPRSRRG